MYRHKITNQRLNQIIITIEDNKLVITIELKIFHFDLPKDADINLKHEIYSIIKHNKRLAEHTIKTRLGNYCPNLSIGKIFMNAKNSKTSEPHKFVLKLSQRLDLRSSMKHVALQNLYIYYTWKTTVQKEQTQNNSSNVE